MRRRDFLRLVVIGSAAAGCRGLSDGQAPPAQGPAPAQGGPIIDVHMHSYPADMPLGASLTNPVTGKPLTAKNGEAHFQACLAEMKRLNIVKGVVSGGDGDRLGAAYHWHDAAPDTFIAGAGIRGSADTPLPDLGMLRKAFADGRLRVLGEVTAMYAGLTLSDPKYEPYLSLAEEFDVPVSLHTGIGPPGASYDPCCRNFRVSFGNPMLIEEALVRHPKLRVNLMHGGWPYLQDTIALMLVYPQVYTDIAGIDWLAPRAAFHAHLQALMQAGLGKRVMFGSDHMYWPEAIGMAVEAVEAATFLSPSEKRDVFYGNAARFLKLEQKG